MDIDAFILIGGRSTRLGTDKAFVEFGGETLALRAARVIDEALDPKHVAFVTSDEYQFNAKLVFGLSGPVVADIKPGFGAWSGLDTALGYAQSEWILVLACDLPFISVELLRLLVAVAGDDNDAVVPRQPDGRLQPLCALYRVNTVRTIVDSVLTGRASVPPLNTIFSDLRTRIVGVDEYGSLPNADKFFLNVNTAIDLANAVTDNSQDFG